MSEKEKSFIEKHKPLTKAEMQAQFKKMEESKKKYTQDVAELEDNLKHFNEIADPLVEPATDKPLCWIRRPSQTEWEAMIPSELLEYRDNPQGVPPDLLQKYNDMTYELMAKLIVKPSHDANWWKSHANVIFIKLFQTHLQMVFAELGLLTENF